ncbi:MAG: hypothetical protein J6J23_03745 [Clostridia bacterium]|nr:hypothetical protein [Clostridia bacterium]
MKREVYKNLLPDETGIPRYCSGENNEYAATKDSTLPNIRWESAVLFHMRRSILMPMFDAGASNEEINKELENYAEGVTSIAGNLNDIYSSLNLDNKDSKRFAFDQYAGYAPMFAISIAGLGEGESFYNKVIKGRSSSVSTISDVGLRQLKTRSRLFCGQYIERACSEGKHKELEQYVKELLSKLSAEDSSEDSSVVAKNLKSFYDETIIPTIKALSGEWSDEDLFVKAENIFS